MWPFRNKTKTTTTTKETTKTTTRKPTPPSNPLPPAARQPVSSRGKAVHGACNTPLQFSWVPGTHDMVARCTTCGETLRATCWPWEHEGECKRFLAFRFNTVYQHKTPTRPLPRHSVCNTPLSIHAPVTDDGDFRVTCATCRLAIRVAAVDVDESDRVGHLAWCFEQAHPARTLPPATSKPAAVKSVRPGSLSGSPNAFSVRTSDVGPQPPLGPASIIGELQRALFDAFQTSHFAPTSLRIHPNLRKRLDRELDEMLQRYTHSSIVGAQFSHLTHPVTGEAVQLVEDDSVPIYEVRAHAARSLAISVGPARGGGGAFGASAA